MIQELQTGILDINNKYNIDFSCKQLDDIILKIIVYDKSLPADLSNYNCRLKAFKADQVPVIQNTNISIKDNVVTIKASKQLTTTVGIVKAELQFINKTTLEKKSTFYLEIKVAASVLDVDGVVSTPTCTILEEIDNKLDQIEDIKLDIIEAVKVKNDLNTSRTDANNMNNTLKTTTTNADNKKKEVETAINNASNKIKEVQDSTNTANTAKQAVDSSVLQANASKQALDTSKVNADNTKKEVDAAIIVADEKIEIIKNLDPENVVEDVKNLKKQVLESTYTKIETDSTLTKLESCKDSFVHNMLLKGRTLQNLATMKTVVFDNFKTILNIVKPLTDYTFKFDIATNSCQINYKWLLQDGKYSEETMFISKSDSNTVLVKKLTSPVNAKELVIWNITSGVKAGNLDNLLILESDWAGKEVPSYFDGIKSVGEAEGNKISILTTGKNLYDNSQNDNKEVYLENGKEVAHEKIVVGGYVKINPSYSYSAYCNKGLVTFRWYDANQKYISGDPINNIPKNARYLRLRYLSTDNIKASEVLFQLEEGTEVTPYEPYKEDKTEILTGNEPLRGFNEVEDIINFDKNDITRNISKMILNGDENGWVKFATDGIQGFKLINPDVSEDNFTCLSDNITALEQRVWYKSNETCIAVSYGAVYLKFKGITEINDMKAKLKANPTTIYFKRANPVPETLQIKDTLQSFENGYIQLDNSITPVTSLEYSTNIPSAIGSLTQIADKLVDNVSNIQIAISDMDAEVDEARKGKNTLNKRLEDDKKEIDLQLKDCAKKDDLDTTNNNLAQLSNPNLLINGGPTVWQRGESFINTTDKYTADRWRILCGGDGCDIQKENSTLKMTIRTISNLWQVIENANWLSNKKITVSFDIISNKNVDMVCAIGDGTHYDNAKNTVNKTYGVTTKKQRVVVTFNVPNITSGNLVLTLVRTSSPCILNISDVKLELGSVATPFVPRSYGEELALCQRYYEKSYEDGTSPGTIGYAGVNGNSPITTDSFVYFKASKRVKPTITIYSPETGLPNSLAVWAPGKYVDCSVFEYHYESENSFSIWKINNDNAIKNIESARFHWIADAEIY